MFQQVLTYWLISLVLGLVGFGWARRLLHGLPDRGYAFARALGLLLSAYLAWLLAMLGMAPFGRGLVLACMFIVGLGGLWLLRTQRRELWPWLRAHWQLVLFYELLFAAALGYMALQRSYEYAGAYPHPWGTERAMDFAFFNAIRSSTVFPPHDPWMVGLSINYYYFGYLMMAAVSLVSDLHPSVSYNLSLALVFALTALGVAGVVVNLVGGQGKTQKFVATQNLASLPDMAHPVVPHNLASLPDMAHPVVLHNLASLPDMAHPVVSHNLASLPDMAYPVVPQNRGDSPLSPGMKEDAQVAEAVQVQESLNPASGALSDQNIALGQTQNLASLRVGAFLAALLAALLVLLVGNQGGSLQVISGTHMILALDGQDMWRALTNGLGPRAPLHFDPPWQGDDFDNTTVITPTDKTKDFNWWTPSRALWGSPPGESLRRYAITEFPLFSFWLGDMHPHVMAMPFMLLAVALALHTLLRRDLPVYGQQQGWLELILAGIVIGCLYTINSWDFPTFLLLLLGALLLRHVAEHGVGLNMSREQWSAYAIQAVSLLVVALLLFLPFFLTFKSLVGAKEPLVDIPILSTISRTVGLVLWTKTPLHTFFIIFGLFLIPLLGFVIGLKPNSTFNIQHSTFLITIGLALLLGSLFGFPLLVLLPLAVYTIGLALELLDEERRVEAFVLWAFGLVCLVCFGTEIIYLRDVFNNRMNTIFKFYYQAWLLLGTLAGYAVWWLMHSQLIGGSGRFSSPGSRIRRFTSLLSLPLFLLFLAGALVYPWLTIGQMFSKGNWYGLQGKTPAENPAGGEAAIAWIRANTPGDAVILEAAGGPSDAWFSYTDFSAVSASTGRATVMGWPGHESQWRAGDQAALEQIQPRRMDVVSIYSDTFNLNQTRELLQRYKVDYIYIGPMERSVYPAESIDRLLQLGDVVFQEGEVTIIHVK